MSGREFVRRARRYARRNDLVFDYDPVRGRGSHGEIHVGDRRTIVQHGEIFKRMLSAMLRVFTLLDIVRVKRCQSPSPQPSP